MLWDSKEYAEITWNSIPCSYVRIKNVIEFSAFKENRQYYPGGIISGFKYEERNCTLTIIAEHDSEVPILWKISDTELYWIVPKLHLTQIVREFPALKSGNLTLFDWYNFDGTTSLNPSQDFYTGATCW